MARKQSTSQHQGRSQVPTKTLGPLQVEQLSAPGIPDDFWDKYAVGPSR